MIERMDTNINRIKPEIHNVETYAIYAKTMSLNITIKGCDDI
jgi:hypothetical protein